MDGRITENVRCDFCNHNCLLVDGGVGLCGVRKRAGDRVESLVYGRVVAENIDPVEKKPLFHVLPSSSTFSIATRGCNFHCANCQNSSISQVSDKRPDFRPDVFRSPEELVERAHASGCQSISYTYVEPTVFFDYAYDCAVLAYEKGLGNLFVSNGYMSDMVVERIAPLLTGINIDLKAWSDTFYKEICGGRLAPVLKNIEKFVELGVWVEVTTLIIPGKNDSEEELHQIAKFLKSVGPHIPWHVSGFYPSYKMMEIPPTPRSSLEMARRIGLDSGLQFVYCGNIRGGKGMNTYCPGCDLLLLARDNFYVAENNLQNGRCPGCNREIEGVWKFLQ